MSATSFKNYSLYHETSDLFFFYSPVICSVLYEKMENYDVACFSEQMVVLRELGKNYKYV